MGKQMDCKLQLKKQLYGGSFMCDIISPSSEVLFSAFLHKSHLEGDLNKVKKIKVKEINFFENYPIITTLNEQVTGVHSFNDIQVGQVYEGTVINILKSHNISVIVQLAEGVTAVLDNYNFNDIEATKIVPKSISFYLGLIF
jgi:hypothetical protein